MEINNTLEKKTSLSGSICFAVLIFLYIFAMSSISVLGRIGNYSRYIIMPLLLFIGILYYSKSRNTDLTTLILFLIGAGGSLLTTSYFSNSAVKLITVALMLLALALFFSGSRINGIALLRTSLFIFAYINIILDFLFLVSGRGMKSDMFVGFYANRNANGPTLVISALVFLNGILKKGKMRFVSIVFFALTVYMILLTGSRGAMLGFLIGLLVFFFFSLKNKRRIILIAGFAIILIIIFWEQISSISVIKRILDEGITRDDLWADGFAHFKENPIFGVGFGSDKEVNTTGATAGMNYHNSYLSLLIGNGFWGCFFFILMFARLGVIILKKYSIVRKEDRSTFVTLMSICCAFLGLSFGEAYLLAAGNPLCFIFWCCVFSLENYST